MRLHKSISDLNVQWNSTQQRVPQFLASGRSADTDYRICVNCTVKCCAKHIVGPIRGTPRTHKRRASPRRYFKASLCRIGCDVLATGRPNLFRRNTTKSESVPPKPLGASRLGEDKQRRREAEKRLEFRSGAFFQRRQDVEK